MVAASSDVIFMRGLDVFGGVVDRVEDGAWSASAPCEGWTALDVLGHLGSAIQFGVAVLQGEAFGWPTVDRPADLVVDEPKAYWAAIAARARSALEGVDLRAEVDTPMGKRTVAEGLAFPAIDLFVHAWDIGRAADIVVEVPDDVIEFSHAYIDPMPSEVVRGPNGAFGPEVEPPDDATPTESFIGWTGRNPR